MFYVSLRSCFGSVLASMKRKISQAIKHHVPRRVMREVRRLCDEGEGSDDSGLDDVDTFEHSASLDVTTPFGPLIAETDVPLEGGQFYRWSYLNPFALLHLGVAEKST